MTPGSTPRPRRRSALAALAIALASGLMLACVEILAPTDFPPGMTPLDPPAIYREWWVDVERCAGRLRPFSEVSWFYVPDSSYFVYRGESYGGYWWDYHHTILLAGDLVDDGPLVRHEMLHDILNTGDHPSLYFVQRCGSVVAHD